MTRPNDLSRRRFLAAGLAAAAAPSIVPCLARAEIKAVPGADKLTTYHVGQQVWVRWANQLLTAYRAHPTQKYPYLYPAAGPLSGLSLTTESSLPFPHHRSILFSCDHVNGANYWQGPLEGGRIVSAGPIRFAPR